MEREKIDALESIFGLDEDELSEVKAGLESMDEEQMESEPEKESEPEVPTLMSKLSASVNTPEAFKFKDKNKFYTMLRNIYRKEWILVTGPSGCGKSSLGRILADITGKPFYAFNMGDTMNPSAKLLGDTKYDASTGTFFKKSRFVQALQDKRGAFVMLDEITRDRTGDLANILMPLLDGQRYLALDESDDAETVELNPDCFFFATANVGREYLGAAHDIDRAYKDRFTGGMYELEYLTKSLEKELLIQRVPDLNEKAADTIVDFAERIRGLYAAEALSSAVSTRMTIATARLVADGFPMADALLQITLPFYPLQGGDDSERVMVKQTIQSME